MTLQHLRSVMRARAEHLRTDEMQDYACEPSTAADELEDYADLLKPHIAREAQREARIAELEAENARLRADKDSAYEERNHVVAALARVFASGIRATDIPGWDPEWHGCVLIDLPTGQVSYHYHDSQAHLFAGLPPYEKPWDGHDKATVHKRLTSLKAQALTPEEWSEVYAVLIRSEWPYLSDPTLAKVRRIREGLK